MADAPPAPGPRPNRRRWSGPQRRIGLTGGIATGKSSAGRWLAARGLPVLDADHFARQALAAGSPGARAVLERYGPRVQASGTAAAAAVLDRAALGAIVFADDGERRWLEQLVHPQVQDCFLRQLSQLEQAPVVVLMVPLLLEAGLEGLCSEVWLVDCDPVQQLARLMARDGLNETEARARIAAQWPLARKRSLVDRLIDNRGTPTALEAQLERALSPGASG